MKCCNCWEHSSSPSKTCLRCPVRDPVLLEVLCLNSTILFSKRLVPLEDFFWETNRISVEVMCCANVLNQSNSGHLHRAEPQPQATRQHLDKEDANHQGVYFKYGWRDIFLFHVLNTVICRLQFGHLKVRRY